MNTDKLQEAVNEYQRTCQRHNLLMNLEVVLDPYEVCHTLSCMEFARDQLKKYMYENQPPVPEGIKMGRE